VIDGKRIIVVMPAYNAEQTLERTAAEIPNMVDEVIVVDDRSSDGTSEVGSASRPAHHRPPAKPRLWRESEDVLHRCLAAGADIVVMVHPDYQYTPN